MRRIIFFLLLIQGIAVMGQVPSNDSSWVLKAHDPFDSLRTNWWWGPRPWAPVANGAEYYDSANLIYSGGILKEKAEKLTTPITYSSVPYYYKSGELFSQFTYLYGYWEIYAKLPQGQGYWPAFWTWNAGKDDTLYPCIIDSAWYNEIDVLEINGLESVTGNTINNHYHYRDTGYCGQQYNWIDPPITISGSDTAWHKYALKWQPNKMTFYFDDQVIREKNDSVYTPRHAMYTIIALGIGVDVYSPIISTTFPAYFTLDYVKIWQQIPDCSNPVAICGAVPSNYDHKVKKTITLEGSGCSGTINTSRQLTLWATDYILLDQGTTINPDGSGHFTIETTICPN